MANQYTKSEINEEAVIYYRDNVESLDKVASKFNVSRKILTRWIKSYDSEIIEFKKKPIYNANYFKHIDSEEKAYWLGFIYADGYVSDSNGFELSLAIKDIDHLSKLANSMKARVADGGHRCRLGIRNTELVNDLKSHGVIPRKSLILTYPVNLKPQLNQAFIRGYFDGDGCISITDKSNNVSLLGTMDMLTSIQQITGIEGKIRHDHRHNEACFSLNYYKNDDKLAFTRYLYQQSTIHLERKYEKYCRLEEKFSK